MKRIILLLMPIVLVLFACSTADKGKGAAKEENYVVTASGLQYYDIVEGTGPQPQAGQTVYVHYKGTLENGKKFDSSYDRGTPFNFVLGSESVIKGWEEGVASMKVGGKRKLVIPPGLAYGSRAVGDVIPPNSTLIFEVELLKAE